MNQILIAAANSLSKRESPTLVTATGMIFQALSLTAPSYEMKSLLVSNRNGVWGEETIEGVGYPVLRSTNMRGRKVETENPAWINVPAKTALDVTLQTGDILVTKSSGSNDLVGKAAIFIQPESDTKNYLFSNFTMRLRPNRLKILPDYLAWYLRSPQSLLWRFDSQQTTVGLRNLQTTEFLAQKIPLPSLEMQREFISYFDGLDSEGTASPANALPREYNQVYETVHHVKELARRVEEARGLRRAANEHTDLLFYSHAKQLRAELLNKYQARAIGEITTVTSGGTPDRQNPLYWHDGTIAWIKTGELLDGEIWDSEEKITNEGLKNSSARMFPVDTVLIALYGQGQTRGRTGLLKIPATTNQACAAIFPQPELFDSRYMQVWLRSLYHEMRADNHGGAQPNWNGGMIKQIQIALPPLDEQHRIVAYLDKLQSKVDELRRLQAATQKELDALMPSVLAKAFAGEL